MSILEQKSEISRSDILDIKNVFREILLSLCSEFVVDMNK